MGYLQVVRDRFDLDSLYGGGPGLFGLSSVEGGATVHGPGLFLIEGQTTFTVTAPTADGETFIEDLVAHGRVTSLCPVLAS